MSSPYTFTIGEAQDFIHGFANSSAGGMLPAREAKLFKEIREALNQIGTIRIGDAWADTLLDMSTLRLTPTASLVLRNLVDFGKTIEAIQPHCTVESEQNRLGYAIRDYVTDLPCPQPD